jgi:3-oxoacyl-[acyl-carrier protein] reductase
MPGRLEGRVAVVTGAAHGIGRGISLALAREGAAVWACDILGEELTATAAAVGPACRTAVVDVTEPRQVEAFVADMVRATGGADVLVNTAGGVAGQTMRPIEEVSDADWRRIFAINLDGAFYFTRAVVPAMKARRRGSIVNISSGAGRSHSLTGIQAYASAKAGLIGLTRQAAVELGAWGIRVNCIAPGFVLSNPATERQWAAMGEDGQRRLLESTALRRLGEPADIARAACFFASDDADWITGQTISVDGGKWMLG